jgi:hypothetical protein
MRALALIALIATAAAADPPPRVRCAACSFLPDGTLESGTLSLLYNNRLQWCSDTTCATYFYITYNSGGPYFQLQGSGGVPPDWAARTFLGGSSSGVNSFAVLNNGGRIDFGAGASDYASSDGTTVNFAGPVTVQSSFVSGGTVRANTGYLNGNAQSILNSGIVTTGDTYEETNVSDSAGNIGFFFGSANTVTSGVDRYLAAFGRSATATVASRIFTDGTYQNLATVGTSASGTGVTATYSGAVRQWVHKVTVTNAAMTAATTTDITLHTTPTNSRIERVLAEVTTVFSGGALSAVTVTCGNSAGGNQYLLSGDVKTAQTTLGDVVAEMGAGLVSSTLADMGTVAAGVPGAITVQCRFTCTSANCNAATQGNVVFIVEGASY